MKSFILTITLLLTLNMTGHAKNIHIDKGILIINVSDKTKKLSWKAKIPKSCHGKTKIIGNETSNSIKLSHIGDFCHQGATIELTLPQNTKTKIHMLSGVIKAKHPEKLTNTFEKIDLEVKYGLIQAQDSFSNRQIAYTGAMANYKKHKDIEDTQKYLSAHLQSGVINF